MSTQTITKNKDLQKNIAEEVNEIMLGRLHEIDGLDSVSWWPLAPGWWFIIIALCLFTIFVFRSYLKKRAWRLSWKGQIYSELDQMQQNMNQENSYTNAIKLSAIIKRIAMHKYSREECAGLEGMKWLKWLSKHDKNFNWEEGGQLLISGVYAPIDRVISINELDRLINATKNWVK